MTGVLFNDAYHYMDWSSAVSSLRIEILSVMKLDGADFNSRSWTLGFDMSVFRGFALPPT